MVVVERNGPAAELVEAVERVDEVAEEGVAPQLAVGDDVEPGLLLESDGVVDGAVLDALEPGRAERAPASQRPARLLEWRRGGGGFPRRRSGSRSSPSPSP